MKVMIIRFIMKKKYQILSFVNEKINKNLKYRYGNTFNYI